MPCAGTAAFERRRHPSATAFIPQIFASGEAYQFDFSHEHVELGGIDQVVKVAHVRLCYSRAFFLVAYPRESQEMVFDAHARAFEFLGGVPRRGIYDNMKPPSMRSSSAGSDATTAASW